jgi:hypothetical protein
VARHYFEKAIDEVNHSNPTNLISIYIDLANIEMDQQPKEALKHLESAIAIIKAAGMKYEYSDAIGFKTIIAFVMHDWELVDENYRIYRQLEKDKSRRIQPYLL